MIWTRSPSSGSGGGGVTTETDPVASPALATHKNSADHDGRYAAATHTAAADPHGDRGYADSRIAALVNAAPAALDTLAEIDAQLSSDETGAAAMQASINQNSTNLNNHLGASPAHASSAVSVNPSGLAVVNSANVQAALAQLDAWAAGRPTRESGTLAARPAASARNAGSVYFATDDNGGTEYRVFGGAWVKTSPGLTEATAATEIAYAENVTGTVTAASSTGGAGALVDVPACNIVVPPSTRPVWIRMEAGFSVTTAVEAAVAYLALVETTGAATVLVQAETPMPNSTTLWGGTGSLARAFRLGPVAAQRTFKLQARVGTPAAVTAAINIANAASAPTFITAESR